MKHQEETVNNKTLRLQCKMSFIFVTLNLSFLCKIMVQSNVSFYFFSSNNITKVKLSYKLLTLDNIFPAPDRERDAHMFQMFMCFRKLNQQQILQYICPVG